MATYNIQDVKDFLQSKKDELEGYQAFDSRNIVGDTMEPFYNKDGVQIDICREWGYIEIFGLTWEAFISICDTENDNKIKF